MIELCPYCAKEHEGICPRVAAINTDAEGRIVRVEFFQPTEPEAPLEIESDDMLRARLRRIVGTTSVNTKRVETVRGSALDMLASEYEIERRGMS